MIGTTGTTDMTEIVSAVQSACGDIAGVIPTLAVAALGVAVLIFGVRVGWRLVKSIARG